MAFTEDFTEFFNTDDFAVTASYTETGQSAVNVDGIFDDEYLLEEGGSVGFASSTPVFHCATSSVSAAAPNDLITINGTNYTIVNVRPDGSGTTILILTEV